MMFTYTASGGLGSGGTTGLVQPRFSYIAKGSLSIRKCGVGVVFTLTPYCYRRFNPGDGAYLGYKAAVGIFEYVVVKKVRLITSYGGHCITLYIDTFNAIYNEWDLLDLSDATALVNAYNLRVLQQQARAECLK